jgi:hypothetical protein
MVYVDLQNLSSRRLQIKISTRGERTRMFSSQLVVRQITNVDIAALQRSESNIPTDGHMPLYMVGSVSRRVSLYY